MAQRYRRYRHTFRFRRQAGHQELLLAALLIAGISIVYFVATVDSAALWAMIGFCSVASLILLGIVFVGVSRYILRSKRSLELLNLLDIDQISDEEFLTYIEVVLEDRGWRTMRVEQPAHFDIDLLAHKGKDMLALQVHHRTQAIGINVIQQATAGCQFYDCTKAMVLTNSTFTAGAKVLALPHKCILVDRQRLARWMMKFQEKK